VKLDVFVVELEQRLTVSLLDGTEDRRHDLLIALHVRSSVAGNWLRRL
jgi:hypothetical protein